MSNLRECVRTYKQHHHGNRFSQITMIDVMQEKLYWQHGIKYTFESKVVDACRRKC